jgi:hypothetical protein
MPAVDDDVNLGDEALGMRWANGIWWTPGLTPAVTRSESTERRHPHLPRHVSGPRDSFLGWTAQDDALGASPIGSAHLNQLARENVP